MFSCSNLLKIPQFWLSLFVLFVLTPMRYKLSFTQSGCTRLCQPWISEQASYVNDDSMQILLQALLLKHRREVNLHIVEHFGVFFGHFHKFSTFHNFFCMELVVLLLVLGVWTRNKKLSMWIKASLCLTSIFWEAKCLHNINKISSFKYKNICIFLITHAEGSMCIHVAMNATESSGWLKSLLDSHLPFKSGILNVTQQCKRPTGLFKTLLSLGLLKCRDDDASTHQTLQWRSRHGDIITVSMC